MFDDARYQKQRSAFVSIVYDEFHPETYDRVEVVIGGHVTKFKGHFFSAYRRARRFAGENADEVYDSSTVCNFAQDLSNST